MNIRDKDWMGISIESKKTGEETGREDEGERS